MPARITFAVVGLIAAVVAAVPGQETLDARVKTFLESKAGEWRDLNVPTVDGQTLHDLIVTHKYTRARETTFDARGNGLAISMKKR